MKTRLAPYKLFEMLMSDMRLIFLLVSKQKVQASSPLVTMQEDNSVESVEFIGGKLDNSEPLQRGRGRPQGCQEQT